MTDVNVITKAYTNDNLQLELLSKTMSIKYDFQKHVHVQLQSISHCDINLSLKYFISHLMKGMKKPYNTVIDVSQGNPHATGVKPLSFFRQVTSHVHLNTF